MTDKIRSIRSSRGTLGRGLSALIADTNTSNLAVELKENTGSQDSLPISELEPSRFQPRTFFNEEELNELADSIRKNGVVQPIIVRKVTDNQYEIIAGERRWRAAKMAGHNFIPAVVMELTDKQALEIALVENIQRQNLRPLEVAEGYRRLMEEFEYTQEQLSEVLGKSRTTIANFLRMVTLPNEVKELINNETLSVGHAKAILGVNDNNNLREIAETVAKKGLNVRQTELLIKKLTKPVRARREKVRDADIADLEKALSNKFGFNISIQNKGNSGKIILSYSNLEQLDNILKRLG